MSDLSLDEQIMSHDSDVAVSDLQDDAQREADESDFDDGGSCDQCGDDDPDSWESACWDDLCHGGAVPCMHGDYSRLPCGICGN